MRIFYDLEVEVEVEGAKWLAGFIDEIIFDRIKIYIEIEFFYYFYVRKICNIFFVLKIDLTI